MVWCWVGGGERRGGLDMGWKEGGRRGGRRRGRTKEREMMVLRPAAILAVDRGTLSFVLVLCLWRVYVSRLNRVAIAVQGSRLA